MPTLKPNPNTPPNSPPSADSGATPEAAGASAMTEMAEVTRYDFFLRSLDMHSPSWKP